MKKAVATLLLFCAVSIGASVTPPEYNEFRRMVAEVQAKLDEVTEDLNYLDGLTKDASGTLYKLQVLLAKYSPDRWAGVKALLEEARVSLGERKAWIEEKKGSIRTYLNDMETTCREIDKYIKYGRQRYSQADTKASRYLAALSTIPFDRIATKDDFIDNFGYYGFVQYDGEEEDDKIEIDFVCGCKAGISDYVWYKMEDFNKIKEAIDEYGDIYSELFGDFGEITQQEIPQ